MTDLEIKYKLVAYVDDTIVYQSEFPDTAMLEASVHKAEYAVERALGTEQMLVALSGEDDG
jgi:hypothetical protein